MESTTQNTTDIEYVSIYDKPKRHALTREEKLERLRQNYKRYYYEDPEREINRKRKEYAFKKRSRKNINIRKPYLFLLSGKK